MKMVTIKVQLTPEELADLEKLAQQLQRSRSNTVRRAVRELLRTAPKEVAA